MIGLTSRQADCLKAIAEMTRQGVAPTYEEIGARIGITAKSSISRLVSGLEERGAIRRIPHRPRALEIISPVVPGKTADDVAATITGHLWARKEAGAPITRPVLYGIVREALR